MCTKFPHGQTNLTVNPAKPVNKNSNVAKKCKSLEGYSMKMPSDSVKALASPRTAHSKTRRFSSAVIRQAHSVRSVGINSTSQIMSCKGVSSNRQAMTKQHEYACMRLPETGNQQDIVTRMSMQTVRASGYCSQVPRVQASREQVPVFCKRITKSPHKLSTRHILSAVVTT